MLRCRVRPGLALLLVRVLVHQVLTGLLADVVVGLGREPD